MMAVAHARVLGPKKARTPQGHPIHVMTAPFDDTKTTPEAAIAQRAAALFGIVPHIPHWTLISTYDVRPDVAVTVKEAGKPYRRCRAKFDVVYVLSYDHEAAMRKHLGIADECLDPFVMNTSWYLEKRSSL
jgi:hypothetical protein